MELELLFPLILVVYAKYTTEKAFDLMASHGIMYNNYINYDSLSVSMMVTVVLRKRNNGSALPLTPGGSNVIVNISRGSPAMPSTEIVMAISIPATGLVSKMSDVTSEKSFAAQEQQYFKNQASIQTYIHYSNVYIQ